MVGGKGWKENGMFVIPGSLPHSPRFSQRCPTKAGTRVSTGWIFAPLPSLTHLDYVSCFSSLKNHARTCFDNDVSGATGQRRSLKYS